MNSSDCLFWESTCLFIFLDFKMSHHQLIRIPQGKERQEPKNSLGEQRGVGG